MSQYIKDTWFNSTNTFKPLLFLNNSKNANLKPFFFIRSQKFAILDRPE